MAQIRMTQRDETDAWALDRSVIVVAMSSPTVLSVVCFFSERWRIALRLFFTSLVA
jgi:hypothetical protein